MWIWWVLVLVAVASAVYLFAPKRGASEDIQRIVDLSRKLMGSTDVRDVAALSVDEALRLSGASEGALLTVGPHALFLVHQTGDVIVEAGLPGSALRSLAERGVPVLRLKDPAVSGGERFGLVVAVNSGGQLAHILVCLRDDRIFTTAEAQEVGRIAPIVGSSLLAAERQTSQNEAGSRDGLTGAFNRRKLDADFAAVASGSGSGRGLGYLMVHVDEFEKFSGASPIASGDYVLKHVAAALEKAVRDDDTVYRYGDDEFAVILRDVTVEQATVVAERARELVEVIRTRDGMKQGEVTVSIGLALDRGNTSKLMAAAATALDNAKSEGRNRVVVSG